jgi:anti-sigma-K factor RskA
MPFRPPSIAITAESELPVVRASKSQRDVIRGSAARSRVPDLSRLSHTGRRFWTVIAFGVLAAGAAATALTFSLAPQPTPVVVPYPAVTGTLGDHLKELQESVEP